VQGSRAVHRWSGPLSTTIRVDSRTVRFCPAGPIEQLASASVDTFTVHALERGRNRENCGDLQPHGLSAIVGFVSDLAARRARVQAQGMLVMGSLYQYDRHQEGRQVPSLLLRQTLLGCSNRLSRWSPARDQRRSLALSGSGSIAGCERWERSVIRPVMANRTVTFRYL